MTPPTPYLTLHGTARQALTSYAEVVGCRVQLHTLAELARTDGPADAVAHGCLVDGPVTLFASDAAGDEPSVRCEGLSLSLLGTASPATVRTWSTRLADGGQVLSELPTRPWGASDGQVVDRYGLRWLLGFEDDETG